jgi:hypothetical protein
VEFPDFVLVIPGPFNILQAGQLMIGCLPVQSAEFSEGMNSLSFAKANDACVPTAGRLKSAQVGEHG